MTRSDEGTLGQETGGLLTSRFGASGPDGVVVEAGSATVDVHLQLLARLAP